MHGFKKIILYYYPFDGFGWMYRLFIVLCNLKGHVLPFNSPLWKLTLPNKVPLKACGNLFERYKRV